MSQIVRWFKARSYERLGHGTPSCTCIARKRRKTGSAFECDGVQTTFKGDISRRPERLQCCLIWGAVIPFDDDALAAAFMSGTGFGLGFGKRPGAGAVTSHRTRLRRPLRGCAGMQSGCLRVPYWQEGGSLDASLPS